MTSSRRAEPLQRGAALPAPRPWRFWLMVLVLALFTASFSALGVWQVQRLAWKLDLIERVDSRIHATPTLPPADWSAISASRDEYRHVRLHGRYLHGQDSRVKALTVFGPGFWILSPFQLDDGRIVLVNRGYVPDKATALPPPAVSQVDGLLRLSEPGGAFLRRNDARHEHWYSRDVAALAQARGLPRVAPFFVDADADPANPVAHTATEDGPGLAATPHTRWPYAGLTVVKFRNHHLSYALTWFALALMNALALLYVWQRAQRRSAA